MHVEVFVVLCELDAVADGELTWEVGVYVDSAQSLWIVGNTPAISSLDGKQVAFGIRRYDCGVGVYCHANLFAAARVVQRVAGVVFGSPCSIWWGKTAIDQIRTVAVEEWLRAIPRANGTKSKIRNTMSALYNHAIRWEFTDKNPITGPVRGSGVRQSAKRERIPDLLEVEEFQHLQADLRLREQILVWLDMTSGLRRGELAGLRWEDVRSQDLAIMAQRSVVDQVVGNVKTEASKRPVPIDPFIQRICWPGIEPPSTADLRTTSSRPTPRGPGRNVASSRFGCRR